ncbi:MAG TPA: hypothetical protein VGB53_10730 [Rubricoccaceae bacterium]|jgi:hypothetical protein
MARFVFAALALVGLAACGDRAASPTLAERAATLSAGLDVDTLTVGGQPEPVRFREASGSTLPVPFTVRVPAPMAVTTERTAAGETLRLASSTPDGAWTLTFLATGTDEAAARSAADSVATTLGTATPDSTAPASALVAFRTAGEGRSGAVWLGQHAGRFFVVASDAADAAREAVDARVAYVLDSWRWTDDGTALGG